MIVWMMLQSAIGMIWGKICGKQCFFPHQIGFFPGNLLSVSISVSLFNPFAVAVLVPSDATNEGNNLQSVVAAEGLCIFGNLQHQLSLCKDGSRLMLDSGSKIFQFFRYNDSLSYNHVGIVSGAWLFLLSPLIHFIIRHVVEGLDGARIRTPTPGGGFLIKCSTAGMR
jgi:hypothetical protein